MLGLSFCIHITLVGGMALGEFRKPKIKPLPLMIGRLYTMEDLSSLGVVPKGSPEGTELKAKEKEKRSAVKEEKKEKKEKVIPKEPMKADIPSSKGEPKLSASEKRQLERAIEEIEAQLGLPNSRATEAEWRAALADISSSLQKQAYFAQAQRKYAEAWLLPASVPRRSGLKVQVMILVDQDGKVRDIKVLSFSGNEALDRSVNRVLMEVKELGPVPWYVGEQGFWLGIEFSPYFEGGE